MYIAVLLILLGLAAFLLIRAFRRRRPFLAVAAVLVAGGAILFFTLMDLWGEVLWFQELGYGNRIWKELWTKTLLAAAGTAIGGLTVYLLSSSLGGRGKAARRAGIALGALAGFSWGLSAWETVLRFLNRVPAGIEEPILGRDAGFYLFVLPLFEAFYTLFIWLALIGGAATVAGLFVRSSAEGLKLERPQDERGGRVYHSLYACGGFLLLVLAWGKYLDRFGLLYSSWGVVQGPGWTDVHIRLPAYAIAVAVALLGAAGVAVPPLRRRLQRLYRRVVSVSPPGDRSALPFVGAVLAATLAVWFLALTVVPGLLQWLRVEPNEISLERPFIANNIRFTRHGFDLHEVEEQDYPMSMEFNRQTASRNPTVFKNIRLWDWRALDAVYKQFQEIRLYYEFSDVDIDRYTFGDQYRQVMVSAREMELGNLPPQSQTFVNRRFKYTHGYGITLATVNEFTEEGLPHLLVKDIPPVSEKPELEVERPEIYYGELTTSPAVANSEEKEFDFPRGEQNVYVHYNGSGGVPLKNLWRKIVFGWKFDRTRFLLSGYPRPESRVMFHRQIHERVSELAPFLSFDDDPYIVLADGELYWIIDGYTTSAHFPYSEPFSAEEFIEYRNMAGTRGFQTRAGIHLQGVNYIRNSVKAVVNAFDGTTDFYIFEPEDPLVRVWDRAFPGLLKPKGEMPEALRGHVRYPADMLLVQGLVYAKYHMTDPNVFYNQEDLWIRATEKYYNNVQPVEPYYVMWELPESDQAEFVLILPFTPKNRQVLIGWIAGMCDPGNYGRFLAYKFPKERRVIGPQQVETKIDQDPYLSGQLTLWDQRGSNVIRGNVLAIPVGETLFYVEPIYLQAETAAYPELRLVVVMHNDRMSYAETFNEALTGLFKGEKPEPIPAGEPGAAGAAVSVAQHVRAADRAFRDYLGALGNKRYQQAAQALEQLQSSLEALMRSTGEEREAAGSVQE
ncbi:MAG: UPF0182 family protein [Candidatus Eisenbacteria bacterium]|nr:UPF0182 family protein [Candidatus Eisenbacteria bacterium]